MVYNFLIGKTVTQIERYISANSSAKIKCDQSVRIYFLSTYYTPGSVAGSGNTVFNQSDRASALRAYVLPESYRQLVLRENEAW